MHTSLSLQGWSLTGLVLTGLAVLINGCQPVTDSLRPQATQADKSQAVRAYIRSLGCPDSLIHDAGDHFVADGDMLFAKNMTLPSPANVSDTQEEQAALSGIPMIANGKRQQNIRVQLEQPLSGYDTELAEACRIWNASNSRIRFRVVRPPNDYDIMIRVKADISKVGKEIIAYAEKRVSSRNELPHNTISVNMNNFSRLDLPKRIHTLAHELGHTIGLAHTDWQAVSPRHQELHLVGTPVIDLASIMNGSLSNGWPTKLSPSDKKALGIIYPTHPGKVTAKWSSPTSTTVIINWEGPMHRVKGTNIIIRPIGVDGFQWPVIRHYQPSSALVRVKNALALDIRNVTCRCLVGTLYEISVQTVYMDDVPLPGQQSRSLESATVFLQSH